MNRQDIATKYAPIQQFRFPERTWPDVIISRPPIWGEVGMRDDNQSLPQTMDILTKLEMFNWLVQLRFKQIEVGYPASASTTDFELAQRLIREKLIPHDVTIQVLTPAKEAAIERTMQAVKGVQKVIIHLYNAISPIHQDVVFGCGREGVKQMAIDGTRWIKDRLHMLPDTDVTLQYSPEYFSATDPRFSLEVCETVMDIWGPTPEHPMILNLPDSAEVSTPNVYADMIEWFCRNLKNRKSVIISIHPHNDRSTGVAKAEFALMAGADRVEGTITGGGERAGNCCIATLALNLFCHGVHPGLDVFDVVALKETYEELTGMTIHPRQPYLGELAFAAFSGGHQDAYQKAKEHWEKTGGRWTVPYSILDPRDIGWTYEVIRFNGQSGGAGALHILEKEFGLRLPKEVGKEFAPIAANELTKLGTTVTAEDLRKMFWNTYVNLERPFKLEYFASLSVHHAIAGISIYDEQMKQHRTPCPITGQGSSLAAFIDGVNQNFMRKRPVELLRYKEYAQNAKAGAKSPAVAFVKLKTSDGVEKWGAGIDPDIREAAIKAVLSAINRVLLAPQANPST